MNFSLAGTQSATFSYICEFHTSENAARAAAFVAIFMSLIWVFMSSLAIILFPMEWIIHIYTLELNPWRLFLVCIALINLWNALVFTYLPESPKFLHAMNRKDETINVLRQIYTINTGQPKEVITQQYIFKLFFNLFCRRTKEKKMTNVTIDFAIM